MGDEHVVFFERARIEQHAQPFARRQFALAMLGIDAALAAAQSGLAAFGFELGNDILHAAPPYWGHPSASCVIPQDSKARGCYNRTTASLQYCGFV